MLRRAGMIHKPQGRQIRLDLYIPQTREEMEIGLSGRATLPSNLGMLFRFPAGVTPSIWMKNTYVPLDIAFLDEQGRILDVQAGIPQSLASVKGVLGSRFVLETPRRAQLVSVGDRLSVYASGL